MKTARRMIRWTTALLAALPLMASAITFNQQLDFNPSLACNGGACVVAGAGSTLSNNYGSKPGMVGITYQSELKSGGTGPMYFWDTGVGLFNFAVGGDLNGGGAAVIQFMVLPSASSVTLKSFDIGSFEATAAPVVGATGQPQQAYSISHNWWALYRVSNTAIGNEIARSWMQSGDPGSAIGVGGAATHVELNGGLGFTDAEGLVLKWGNSAELTSYMGLDNLNFSYAAPVPEGSSLALMLGGLVAVAWAGRRRAGSARTA